MSMSSDSPRLWGRKYYIRGNDEISKKCVIPIHHMYARSRFSFLIVANTRDQDELFGMCHTRNQINIVSTSSSQNQTTFRWLKIMIAIATL